MNIGCPVCSKPLSIRIARGRKSNKPFLMLKCDIDGRHFRGFITDQDYLKGVFEEKAAIAGDYPRLGSGLG